MKLKFYGGAGEVGRSCIEVDGRFFLDAGLKITEDGTEYPEIDDCSHIEAVFLSHAHLDHCGALSLFNKKGLHCSIYCTSMTRETAKILLKDSYKIEMMVQKEHPIYDRENLKEVVSFFQAVNFNKSLKTKGIKARFHYGGHIPGAAGIELKIDDKRIFYTGDFSVTDCHLVKGAEFHPKDVDVMIVESTYGDRNHSIRKKEEEKFLDAVADTLDNGGIALVPAFAVGRAQEVMQILNTRKFNVPIYLDGMSKKVTNLYMRNPSFVSGHDELKRATNKVKYVKRYKERPEIVKRPCIIVTTSGMLDGGPVLDYLGYLFHDEKNSILLTGYQGEGSNGRLLLEEGRVFIDGIRRNVKCDVGKYDFSAHAGRREIINTIKKINPKTLVVQHGDKEALESLRDEFKDKMKVIVPKNGQEFDI